VTGGAKLRLALDGGGGESTASIASCLAPEGTVVAYSGISGKLAQISPLNVIFRVFHPFASVARRQVNHPVAQA
jgi:NADPH:quinone reductase-like Zn-dependent oxidoreductase